MESCFYLRLLHGWEEGVFEAFGISIVHCMGREFTPVFVCARRNRCRMFKRVKDPLLHGKMLLAGYRMIWRKELKCPLPGIINVRKVAPHIERRHSCEKSPAYAFAGGFF